MATYAIGDIQGCYLPFIRLLQQIGFDRKKDRLWLAGDLVNRGPDSVSVLRFLSELANPPHIVLGNHDLHLLAVYAGAAPLKSRDTFTDVLEAEDGQQLCEWLRQQYLLHHDAELGYTLTHAGLYPSWNLATAQRCAHEVEQVLHADSYHDFLQNMYGNQPDYWDESLTGWDRLRFITNVFTRMRFCDASGRLNLTEKDGLSSPQAELLPWFLVPRRNNKSLKLLFGHWAALEGRAEEANIFPLDTGCVWGRCLTAKCLENGKYFRVSCS